MLSIKSVNALSHYTDWNIAHVHAGALGWVGFMVFGMTYWLIPRLYQTPLYSKKLATAHFWTATIGIVLYVIAMWVAGLTQGLMWRAFDDTGHLQYPDFLQTVTRLAPMYYVRALGGGLYITGLGLCGYNLYKTWQARPATYAEIEVSVPPRIRDAKAAARADQPLEPAVPVREHWHRRWEGLPALFTVLVVIAVLVASAFEFLPAMLIEGNVPTIKTVKPYTPLELYGRDIYIREGCYNCHSQMVRPFIDETVRYGQNGVPAEYSKPGEFIYDHPFQWGSKRTGPDLARVGGKYSDDWQRTHLNNPRDVVPESNMPGYPWLARTPASAGDIQAKMVALRRVGVPYTDEQIKAAPDALKDKTEQDALVAYLQGLGLAMKSAR